MLPLTIIRVRRDIFFALKVIDFFTQKNTYGSTQNTYSFHSKEHLIRSNRNIQPQIM